MDIPKGYKMSEFGIIPNDWIEAKWGDCLATFSSGATPYRGVPAYYKGNVKWISSGELNYNVISDTIEHISEQAVRDTNLKVHQPGTMLIAITGLEAEGTRGRCALVGTPATTNQSCLALNGTDKVCIEYLFEFYKKFGCALAFKYCQGTKQQSYTAEIVKKLPIIYPHSIDEQKAIAMALSNIDELIAGLGEQIEKKRQIKDGAMQQLLTGKTRLPGFNGDWMKVSLGEIGTFVSGGGFPLQYQGNLDEELPFYKVSDFNNSGNEKYMIVANNYVSRQTAKFLGCKIIPAKSIVFAKIGAALMLERKRITSTDCCIDNNMMSFQPNDNLDVEFLHGILLRLSLSDFAEVTALPSLKQSSLQKIVIHIPQTKEEQSAIAQILSDMDDEIRQLEAERDKYAFIKQGMMQELLTGKTRLV